jgi:predicted membrane channel-forming protein YqfA (hemolysin III family)
MTQQALEPHRSRIPRFFRTPSTRLGWAAISGAVGTIVLVIVVNIMVAGQGPPEGDPWWWRVFGISALVCLLASGVAGLMAVVRNRERSWMVIAATAPVLVVAVNELLEGLRYLLGG